MEDISASRGFTVFRVVTYNTRAGLGQDGIRSIRRIADALSPLSPDIICLQEIDQRVIRSWLSNQPKFMSVQLHMQAVFQRNVKFGFGGFGNCILVKNKALHYRLHSLPGSGEQRGVIEANVQLGEKELTIFCTHLSTNKQDRIEQAKAVSDIVRNRKGPKILCGDMNDIRSSETLTALLDEPVMRDSAMELDAGDAPTKSQDDRRIDFIIASLELDVKTYQVIDSIASDHYPVAADMDFA